VGREKGEVNVHNLQLAIPPDKFEELNRMASDMNYVSIEAYLLHVALRKPEPIPAPPELRPKKKPETQSVVDNGARGA
jgi:hypothetical protein